jgi:hypothetical protein
MQWKSSEWPTPGFFGFFGTGYMAYWGTIWLDIDGLYAHVGGSGGSTSRALLTYVFLRENTQKLDAEVMGQPGNLYCGGLLWDI